MMKNIKLNDEDIDTIIISLRYFMLRSDIPEYDKYSDLIDELKTQKENK